MAQALRVNNGGGGALLREAAAHGDVKIVEKLLAIKMNPFAADEQATTAMHLAALNGHKECFAELSRSSSA